MQRFLMKYILYISVNSKETQLVFGFSFFTVTVIGMGLGWDSTKMLCLVN